ncbi:NAD(P)H-dependent dehydrogenase/reductase [Geothermobacter hydrogeniphilus]|uniref:NAD(P)H-dependent dehydrogenase/reductase n=1 Tax=Geothermobacter hydrogeniphilus TaxID=1969733 RepID=A0A2K2HCA3_9BACT|nr:nitroreductase family protein [Geothermobacter hydrogeniphilus]PNU20871.1 NAD(P)H-dependent dehydrogenase/reductase [Geothermobacter hydrogeniphilus]
MLELLRQRRSIRKFQSRPVDVETQQQLIEAVLRSPSSRGRNPWEFIVVDDPALLTKLAACKRHGSAFLAGAPLAVVVAADPRKSDVWIEDCAIAAIILQLTAASLGLGSCWAQIRLRDHDDTTGADDYIRQLLGLPEGLQVESVVGIGYPAEEKPGHPAANLLSGQVHRNRFGTGR